MIEKGEYYRLAGLNPPDIEAVVHDECYICGRWTYAVCHDCEEPVCKDHARYIGEGIGSDRVEQIYCPDCAYRHIEG